MAKLLKLRFLDLSDIKNNTYIEVYCDESNKRGYFRKLTKELAKADNTTIRPTQNKFFEIRLLCSTWKQIDKDKFQKQLNVINRERLAKDWPPVVIPNVPTKE